MGGSSRSRCTSIAGPLRVRPRCLLLLLDPTDYVTDYACSVAPFWDQALSHTCATPMIVRQAMCVRDGGRSLGAGLRRQAPNHLERLGSRAPVVSVKEKARHDRVRCGSERRTRVNHR